MRQKQRLYERFLRCIWMDSTEKKLHSIWKIKRYRQDQKFRNGQRKRFGTFCIMKNMQGTHWLENVLRQKRSQSERLLIMEKRPWSTWKKATRQLFQSKFLTRCKNSLSAEQQIQIEVRHTHSAGICYVEAAALHLGEDGHSKKSIGHVENTLKKVQNATWLQSTRKV